MNNVATKMQDAVASYATPNWNVDAAIWSAEHEPRVRGWHQSDPAIFPDSRGEEASRHTFPVIKPIIK
jgi:hypothetical protein